MSHPGGELRRFLIPLVYKIFYGFFTTKFTKIPAAGWPLMIGLRALGVFQ
jgi:hypothetical protein